MVLKPLPVSGQVEPPIAEISQEALRSILFQIETELQQSEVYKRTLETLQQSVGSEEGGAQFLIRALSREAIRLAFKQLALQSKPHSVETQGEDEGNTERTPLFSLVQDSSQIGLATGEGDLPISHTPNLQGEMPVSAEQSKQAAVVVELQPPNADRNSHHKRPWKKKKKLSKAELAVQQNIEVWQERICQIGEELKQARLNQSLSQKQLHSQTRVPLYQIQALEQGDVEQLPEDIYVRGFVRTLGNSLGLDGFAMAATLPLPDPVRAVVPSWYGSTASVSGALRPVHIYLGYAALMTGAMGSLIWMSHQTAPGAAPNPDPVPTPDTAVSQQSLRHTAPTTTPGVKASKIGAIAGPDIAPPETLVF